MCGGTGQAAQSPTESRPRMLSSTVPGCAPGALPTCLTMALRGAVYLVTWSTRKSVELCRTCEATGFPSPCPVPSSGLSGVDLHPGTQYSRPASSGPGPLSTDLRALVLGEVFRRPTPPPTFTPPRAGHGVWRRHPAPLTPKAHYARWPQPGETEVVLGPTGHYT